MGQQARVLTGLGGTYRRLDDLGTARSLLEEALTISRTQGNTTGAALEQQSLAVNCLLAGRVPEARDVLSGILGFVVSSGDTEWARAARRARDDGAAAAPRRRVLRLVWRLLPA